jgi:RNA polymerase sigma-70 factor (family 1)
VPLEAHDSENEWLRQVANGNEAAFARLFAHYSPWVYATSLRLTESSELAEEIVQDVFMKIWLNRSGLPEINRFADYLFIIARNQSFTAMRRLIRRHGILGDLTKGNEAEDNATDAEILYKDYQSVLQEAISRLPSRQNEVYKLCKQKGLKKEEAARLLGISPHTVKIHLKEALRSIRAYYLSHIHIQAAIPLLWWFLKK